ncbi:restriction endonuclease [Alteribacter keqinensis]|uniref:Restriction endonuclease n=1 Tax=Alteribacter keqinensis TaxID=2483800 RepID=A0A3M7TUZ7_9BACI|nr:restriction endonuclease [Alteribacter keqinensis]RNA68554.1 restriction endonuclease [Alteribacter keqinensis]
MLANKINTSLELKKTLAMGLAYRFNLANKDIESEKVSELFLKNTPTDFEHFVGQLFQEKYGGELFVTNSSGDFGVDFELKNQEELSLGQVKAYKGNVNYEPIALVHSNMIKHNAKKGYVITTSDFTAGAKQYASDLNIDLINGVDLVNLWIETMDSSLYELNPNLELS